MRRRSLLNILLIPIVLITVAISYYLFTGMIFLICKGLLFMMVNPLTSLIILVSIMGALYLIDRHISKFKK